jgi:hypothetical protein
VAQSKENVKTRPDLGDQEWLVWLDQQPENKGIEVHALYRQMVEWAFKNGKTASRLRLLNWIAREREAMPMTLDPPGVIKPIDPDADCDECDSTRRVIVNDNSTPCPKCRPAEEKAYWKRRGK